MQVRLQRRTRFQITTGPGGLRRGPTVLGVTSSCMNWEMRNIFSSLEIVAAIERGKKWGVVDTHQDSCGMGARAAFGGCGEAGGKPSGSNSC